MKNRLKKLEKAAVMLGTDVTGIRGHVFSCLSVGAQLGLIEKRRYQKSVGANSRLLSTYSEKTQLARQLAVLMYMEGLKRGKY